MVHKKKINTKTIAQQIYDQHYYIDMTNEEKAVKEIKSIIDENLKEE